MTTSTELAAAAGPKRRGGAARAATAMLRSHGLSPRPAMNASSYKSPFDFDRASWLPETANIGSMPPCASASSPMPRLDPPAHLSRLQTMVGIKPRQQKTKAANAKKVVATLAAPPPPSTATALLHEDLLAQGFIVSKVLKMSMSGDLLVFCRTEPGFNRVCIYIPSDDASRCYNVDAMKCELYKEEVLCSQNDASSLGIMTMTTAAAVGADTFKASCSSLILGCAAESDVIDGQSPRYYTVMYGSCEEQQTAATNAPFFTSAAVSSTSSKGIPVFLYHVPSGVNTDDDDLLELPATAVIPIVHSAVVLDPDYMRGADVITVIKERVLTTDVEFINDMLAQFEREVNYVRATVIAGMQNIAERIIRKISSRKVSRKELEAMQQAMAKAVSSAHNQLELSIDAINSVDNV